MESDALMIATTSTRQISYGGIVDNPVGGPSETSTLALQSTRRKKKIRGVVMMASSMIVVLCGMILLLLIVPTWTPHEFVRGIWNIPQNHHLSVHVPTHSFLAASDLIVVGPMMTPSSSTSTNSNASNNLVTTSSSSSGRSIPLTPAADMPFPKWTRPSANTTDTTTTPLPFSKLGVVRTRPGQGSFFQYWFGHEVFPAIRQEQIQYRQTQQSQEEDGILAFTLHTQQGQPDTFWVLQIFTSEEYFLNVYTPTIYNNNARLQKMRQFLLDEAPLLNLDLSGAPICVKGFPQLEERFDEPKKTANRNKTFRRNVQGEMEPTKPIDPQQRKKKSDNVTDPEQSTTTSNGNDNNTTDTTPPAKNQGPVYTPPPAPYTVVMHLIIQPHKLVAFTEWFQSRLCHTIIQNGTKIINSLMYSIQKNQIWIYQTHRSQRDFLEYAEQLYSSGPAPALPLPWWSQQQQQKQQQQHDPTLSQELQTFLQKRVEFVALDPTLIRLAFRSLSSSTPYLFVCCVIERLFLFFVPETTTTMKTAILASLLASAAAFAPASQVAKSSTALSASGPFENEPGVLAPTGYFDPAKLSYGISDETFAAYRAAELKHGRVAMLAVLGYVATETYRFPFDISPGIPCADVPSGIAAIQAIPFLGWAQIIALIGAVDYYGFLGDFDYGKLDLEPQEYFKRQTQELQHGRLAMLAFLELIRHDSQNLTVPGFDGLDNLITGLPFIYS
ncbi:chlorophyll A-B binding protein [Nitzschia inconspicua]|uniref:Chlorophyll A-B binding protein n=1 Tax=Nitzschia inconspicua TaxID=303405 RepID=A0A9K3KTA3_9STRA|nr:chlorophyll A-B binding protein [Nitzschia inconspicua]